MAIATTSTTASHSGTARSLARSIAVKHVALLRGINVGGNNKLPMKELCALFFSAGCADVSSYIQSGNVIFAAPANTVAALTRTVEAAIEKQFAFKPPIQLRSASELA